RQQHVRLLSLIGGPGVGKTHLAVEAAESLMREFPDGVFLVELAWTRDAGLVASAIATTLGLKEAGHTPITETLKEYLSGKRLLLVLDNFEHVLPAALLVADLLASVPALKALATSRALLDLTWEHVYDVPALALPNPRTEVSLEDVQQSP